MKIPEIHLNYLRISVSISFMFTFTISHYALYWYRLFADISDELDIKLPTKEQSQPTSDPRVIQDIASLTLLFDALVEYDVTMKQLVSSELRTWI